MNDLIVIGAGPGGYTAAAYASKRGMKVALVHRGEWGGNCLHWGCIPTKALLNDAFDDPKAPFAKIMARKDRVVMRLAKGVEKLITEAKVDVLTGDASIDTSGSSPKVMVDGKVMETKHVLLATGSKPSLLTFKKSENVLTSDEILYLKEVPVSICILGSGAVGIEFASLLSKLGSKVHVVEIAEQVIPAEDLDIAKLLQKSLERQGCKFYLKNSIESLSDGKSEVAVKLKDGTALKVSKVLIAVGRKFENESWKLKLGNKGEVVVDSNYQASVKNVFAIGDMIGQGLLAHLAMHQGIQAVNGMLGQKVKPLQTVPAGIFTVPEVASVGVKQKQITNEMELYKFDFNHLGKMQAINENDGFIKMIVDKKSKKILGVSMIGPHVVDLISEATLAIENGLTAYDIAATIHPHPTLSEGLWELAMQAIGHPIHAAHEK